MFCLQAGSRLSGGRLNSEIDAQKCAALDDKNKEILHHLLYQEKMLQRQQREIKNIQLKQSDRIPPNIKGKGKTDVSNNDHRPQHTYFVGILQAVSI